MLSHLVRFSLRFQGVVLVLACLVIGYGLYVAGHAKLDVFPEFVPPEVTIQTEAPGLAPEQVEALVTRPVENAINGLGDLDALRSESIEGLSAITAVFRQGTNIFMARQNLAERLAELAGQLPEGVKPPRMEPLTSSTMDLLKIGLTSDRLTPMELRTFADWTLKPRLLAVPGVAKCSVYGGEAREFQIQVDPMRLRTFEVSVQDVLAAGRAAAGVRGAGFVETPNQRIVVQVETPRVTTESLGETVLDNRNGKTLRLKDLAHVVEAPQPKVGDALIQGRPGVLLTLSSQYRANTMEVTLDLESRLEEMKPALAAAGIVYHPGLHRPASFISAAIRNVRHSLLLGGILVTLVLFLFLMNVRTALISLTAIPLSLLAAVIVLDKFGFTLNTITLGGLAIAIGEVVDDAIIDVENIYRRLRENQNLPAPRRAFQVVLDASLEVRSAVVYATFVVTMVFVPVLTMTGLQGRFFAPLGWAYIAAILASLLVALTLTPALALLLLGRAPLRAHEPWLQRGLKAGYRWFLDRISRHAGWVMAGVLVLCGLVALTLPFFGEEFLPTFREGHFVLQITTPPGTSLPEMRRLGERISAELLKNPRVATVEQQIGRAELGEDTWGPERCEFHVNLAPLSGAAEAQAEEEIRDTLKTFEPAISFEVTTFLGDRISESISGETAAVVVNVFGDNLDLLDAKAKEIAQVLEGVPGAEDVRVKSPPGTPRMVIRPRAERLLQFGYKPAEVLEAVQVAFQGQTVAQVYEANRVFDVAVISDPLVRQEPEQVSLLPVQNATGAVMPLGQLAEVFASTGRASILHEGAQRRQAITCNPRGIDPAAFVAEARRQISQKVTLPASVFLDYAGEAQAQKAARNELILHSAIAGTAILILLALVFGNLRNLLLLLVNLPFALVGGVLATMLTAHDTNLPSIALLLHHPAQALADLHLGTLSVGAMVGFVTLFGITTRNSIMMLSHFEHLVQQEGVIWGSAAAVRGASERLVPILMTALVTALGLLPLAAGTGEAGQEIEGPMAIVILGGLATSTLLNLLIMPTLALRFGRFVAPAPVADTEVQTARG